MSQGKHTKWLAVLGLLAVLACLGSSSAYEQYQAWRAEATYRTCDADAKRAALRLLGRLQTPRSRRVIRQALADPVPMARVAAGNAVFIGRYTDLVDDLWAAIQREGDSPVRASLIVDWSQTVGVQAEPRLREFAQSTDAYDRLAAAKALLRLSNVTAADTMFAFASDADRFKRRDAQKELLSFARPMGQMIGQAIRVPAGPAGRWSPQDLEELHGWWQTHVTPRLLKDYLAWRYDKPENWRKVNTLLHEWENRSPKFLPTGEDEVEE